ncbi:hypothetical protein FACS1894161_1120 [Spirochaetia bacterium]|nr:hypothetical protein FACS1894161_1120 [Spirochaetia bacterium]
MAKKICMFFGFILLTVALNAINLSELRIIAKDGIFLGTFENEYSSNSIYNEYGNYGSPYNSKSIFNKYGDYGSDYSNSSPFNAYATNPPGLYDRNGNFYGTLSVNRYAQRVTDYSYRLALQLKAIRDSM